MRRRRRILILVATLIAIAIPAGLFGYRALSSSRYANVRSIETSETYEDPALVARAWQLPVARTFHRRIRWQTNGSICGPTSVANVFRSLGDDATTRSVLEGTGYCVTGLCFFGMTLDEVAHLVREDGHRATVLRDLSLAQFRARLRETNDESVRYIVNFDRGPLFGHGGGHFSPIGGYLEDRDLVFVLDVNREYHGPWLVSSERLFRAVDTVDSATGEKRGLLRIQ